MAKLPFFLLGLISLLLPLALLFPTPAHRLEITFPLASSYGTVFQFNQIPTETKYLQFTTFTSSTSPTDHGFQTIDCRWRKTDTNGMVFTGTWSSTTPSTTSLGSSLTQRAAYWNGSNASINTATMYLLCTVPTNQPTFAHLYITTATDGTVYYSMMNNSPSPTGQFPFAPYRQSTGPMANKDQIHVHNAEYLPHVVSTKVLTSGPTQAYVVWGAMGTWVDNTYSRAEFQDALPTNAQFTSSDLWLGVPSTGFMATTLVTDVGEFGNGAGVEMYMYHNTAGTLPITTPFSNYKLAPPLVDKHYIQLVEVLNNVMPETQGLIFSDYEAKHIIRFDYLLNAPTTTTTAHISVQPHRKYSGHMWFVGCEGDDNVSVSNGVFSGHNIHYGEMDITFSSPAISAHLYCYAVTSPTAAALDLIDDYRMSDAHVEMSFEHPDDPTQLVHTARGPSTFSFATPTKTFPTPTPFVHSYGTGTEFYWSLLMKSPDDAINEDYDYYTYTEPNNSWGIQADIAYEKKTLRLWVNNISTHYAIPSLILLDHKLLKTRFYYMEDTDGDLYWVMDGGEIYTGAPVGTQQFQSRLGEFSRDFDIMPPPFAHRPSFTHSFSQALYTTTNTLVVPVNFQLGPVTPPNKTFDPWSLWA